MREIKFRGRDGDDWYYGSLFVNECGHTAISAPKSFWMKPVNADTVGQFTGAKDINGKESYEGDIIKFYDDRAHELVGVIKWNTLACRWYVDCSVRDCPYHVFDARYAFEIIGNVYDNPELLEGKDA